MGYKDPIKAKEYMKAWYEANKEQEKVKKKAWYEVNKEQEKVKMKAWKDSHKEHCKEYDKEYQNADLNSLGQTKYSIRKKSRRYLMKFGQKIEGYQIHHCFTYNEPYKFIYCSRQMHRLIHSYLKQHNIDADSEHYQYIKHLLDDTVIKYNIE